MRERLPVTAESALGASDRSFDTLHAIVELASEVILGARPQWPGVIKHASELGPLSSFALERAPAAG
jgi:hypothetical protein